MKFSSPALVEQTLWDLRLADQPRGINRSLIARLFNGLPPWTKEEAASARINTNVNWLEAPRLAADARRSYANAFLKPGNRFNVTCDYGNAFNRRKWGNTISAELNKILKASRRYFEFVRSQSALSVLHGISPMFWVDRESWCPRALGVEDVMIPSNTLLTLENLGHFGIFRQYTAMELYEKTHGPKVDEAWNMPVVEAALKWVQEQTQAQLSYSELYAPEKVEDRWKQDLGFYGTDAIPTVDCWDFYFYSDEGDQQGWRRRMILDTPTASEAGARMPDKNRIGAKHGEWLYCPKNNRIYAEKIDQIIQFQFADATATAPFRYHSVRSLGWLLYAVCHLQNRLRCKVNDAVFESMLQYFRTSNPDDKERIEKIDLHDLGVIPDGVNFVLPTERWKVDYNLLAMGIQQNQQMMTESAAQYREGRNASPAGKEKTATEIMAEVNSQNAMVGALLLQAYEYKRFEGIEIARRFCVKNSKDPEVRRFRVNVLNEGVPEEALNSSMWNIEPERVLGNGNKTLEIAMADKLMAARPLYDPESQREILYVYTMANSDSPDFAERLVPLDKARVSSSVHEAQAIMGSLMLGVPVEPVKGQNPIEMVETLFAALAAVINPIVQSGTLPTKEQLFGFANVEQTIGKYISMLAEDKAEKQRVKKYSDHLNTIQGMLKKMAKDVVTQPAPGGNGQGAPPVDPKDQAKADAIRTMAQTKAQAAQQSHAQRTQQREVAFSMEQRRDAERHQADMQKRMDETKTNAAATDIKTAAEIKKNRLKALQE